MKKSIFFSLILLSAVRLTIVAQDLSSAAGSLLPDSLEIRGLHLEGEYRELLAYLQPTLDRHDSLQTIQQARVFIGMHPDYPIGLLLLRNLLLMGPVTHADERLAKFTPQLQQSDLGRTVRQLIDKASIQVGEQAPDFTAATPDGKTIRLADLKGKYVLVDIWASWCGPCRAENPNLLQAWQDYQQHPFTILGYSMDEKKSMWTEAVTQDRLPWYQVSDLQAFHGPTALTYQISSIPRNFLLDPSGKIIAMDLRGGMLEAELKKIFP